VIVVFSSVAMLNMLWTVTIEGLTRNLGQGYGAGDQWLFFQLMRTYDLDCL
jgi:hypothetical protein